MGRFIKICYINMFIYTNQYSFFIVTWNSIITIYGLLFLSFNMIRCKINISCLYLMLVLYMNISPLTEYRMTDIGVVLRIYEWVFLYAAVLYGGGWRISKTPASRPCTILLYLAPPVTSKIKISHYSSMCLLFSYFCY